MREAIGGSQLLVIILTLIVVIMMLLAGSIGYTKAFKARNNILNIVQSNGGYGVSAESVMQKSEKEIGELLNEMGYKTNIGTNGKCSNRELNKHSLYEVSRSNDYNFCIYRFVDEDSGNQYYGVETYMYFELPVFGRNDRFSFPIYGESYVFFKVS